MKKTLLLFIMFLSVESKSGSFIAIKEEEEVEIVRNNVMEFWREHRDLIPLLSDEEPLPQEQFQKLKNSRTWVARGYRESKRKFKENLYESIRYVTSNFESVSQSLGEKDAEVFKRALFALNRLIKKIPR